MTDFAAYSEFLEKNGYLEIREIPGTGMWAGVRPLLFTHAIVSGMIGDVHSVFDRWCYENERPAREALEEWAGRNYQGEPEGWHRHPKSGRRRPQGDKTREEIRP